MPGGVLERRRAIAPARGVAQAFADRVTSFAMKLTFASTLADRVVS
jgi:hypothetical protein